MVLRLLPLALFVGATSLAAQVPTRAPTRAAAPPTLTVVDESTGWFGFRHDVVRDSLVVLEVASGSPADRAGLRKGDLITLIDGRQANPTTLREKPPVAGETRTLTVRRGTRTLTLSMIAEAPPARTLLPSRVALTRLDTVASETRQLRGQMALQATRAVTLVPTQDSGRSALTGQQLSEQLERSAREQNAAVARLTRAPNAISGAEFEELNPGLAEYFYGVSEGVFVLRVAEQSPASSGGLRPGDIIQSVNGQEIRTIAELRAAIAASERTTNLRILRKGAPSALTIEYFGSATRRPPER